MKNNFKKLIALTLILGLNAGSLSIFLLPKIAHAQTSTTPVEIPSIQATTVSQSETQKELMTPPGGLPKIPAGESVVGGSKCLISWKKGLKKAENLTTTAAEETADVESVPVGGLALKNISRKLGVIDQTTKGTENDTTSLVRKERCFDGLATLLSRMLIQQFTKATVDWINNGFEGPNGEKSPLYVSKPGQFWKNFGDAQIHLFGLDLIKSGNPYAGAFFKGFTDAIQKRFDENARYSFNEVMSGPTGINFGASIALTVDDFYRDFGAGGWSAWLALTQVPYNNPIGAQIEFSQELGRRLRGTYLSAAQQLRGEISAAGGFLGDERCIESDTGQPSHVTRRSHNLYIQTNGAQGEPCAGHFEYVTPGKLVASTIEWNESSPLRQLELSREITDSIAAIIDALIAHYSAKFFKGLKRDIEPIENVDFGGSTPPPYIPDQYLTGDWFVNHPNFDISQGIPQAVIDEQRTFVEKLQIQNSELPKMIQWIYQLDYCIPGPHPGWQEDSQEQLNKLFEPIPNIENLMGQKANEVNYGQFLATGAALGAAVGSVVPGLGTLVGAGIGAGAGLIAGWGVKLFKKIKEDDVNDIGAVFLETFLDIDIKKNNRDHDAADDDDGEKGDLKGVGSKQAIIGVLQVIFDDYAKKLTPRYAFPQTHMPTVTPEAKTEFESIPGYQNIIKQNEERISIMQSIIKNLELLKTDINNHIASFNNGTITYNAFVTGLNNFGATFARLTNQMVSGDDITIADDFKKQIQDRTVYIKDVLVGTPITVGCERELTQLNQGTYGQYLHRQTYPPIFGRPSGATNYSPSFNDGFLDKFNYLSAWNGNPDTVNCSGAIDRITVPADSAGGLKLDFTYNSKNSCDVVSRRFEKMIGIY